METLQQNFHYTFSPNDVFRVPLLWMVLDSEVDVYVMRKNLEGEDDPSQPPVLLLENIASTFSKTAKDKLYYDFCQKLKSVNFSMNKDFYATMDVQGYSCLPKKSQDMNPL